MLVKNNEAFKVNTTKNMGRFYIKDGIHYPSVTTIIHFDEKKKFKGGASPSAAIGSIVHYKILRNYAREQLDMPTDPVWRLSADEVHGRINRCLEMWQKLNLDIEPVEVETALFSDDPRYAGRLDMLCYLDGVYSLLDIKTGLSYEPDHSMQAAAYWHALDREPEQVAYIYLDSIIDRNPAQQGKVHIYDKAALLAAFDGFKCKYANYIMPKVEAIS